MQSTPKRLRRALLAFLTVALLAFSPPSAAGDRSQKGNPSDDVEAALRFAAAEWNPPGGYRQMRAVAWCESGWLASNTNGSHDGLFAQKRTAWAGRVRTFNDHVRLHNERHPDQQLSIMAGDRWAAIDNARVSAAMAAGVLPGYPRGWSHWRWSQGCWG